MSNGGYKGASPARETSPEQYPGVWELTEQFQAQADGNWPFQAADCAPKSLRFEGSSAYLSRTLSASSNRRTWTMSMWVKRAKLGALQDLFGAGQQSTNDGKYARFQFMADDTFRLRFWTEGISLDANLQSTRVFRDCSAFYHFVIRHDSTETNQEDRLRIYVNNELITSYSSPDYLSQNVEGHWNFANKTQMIGAHYDGGGSNTDSYFDGCISEVHHIDGQSLPPEEFGFYDGQGIWQPKRFTGDYSSGPIYSNAVPTADGFRPNRIPYHGFDGDLTTYIALNNTTFNLDVGSWGLSGTLEVYTGSNHQYAVNGGSASNMTASGWTNVGNASSITTLTLTRTDSNYPYFNAVRLNGVILTDASVGRNSFHLDFSDGVKDQSGLGNDWTSNGITLRGDGTIYSDSLTSTASFSANNPKTYGFDGSIAGPNVPYVGGSAAAIVWTPPGGYTYSEKIEMYVGGISGFRWNLNGGGWVNATVNSWNTVAVGSGTITTLSVDRNGSGTHGWHALKVDGQILIDGQYPDFFVDSPVNGNEASTGAGNERRGNYATLSPIDTLLTANGTISNGNLKFVQSSTGARGGRATIGVSSGKYYWEFTHLGGNASHGIAKNSSNLGSYPGGNDADGISWFVGGNIYRNGSTSTYAGKTYAVGDVIGTALDMDAGTVTFYKNGVSQGVAATGLTGTWFPGFGSSNVSVVSFEANFGQRGFKQTPPSGFSPLATSFLPEPATKRGDDFVGVSLYTGNGVSNTISGLRFSPDLTIVKMRSSDPNGLRSPIWTDTVRGIGKSLLGDDGSVEATTTNDLTAFTEDGFSVGSEARVNGSALDLVGWSFDAGEATTTLSAGSQTSAAYNTSRRWSDSITTTGNSGVWHSSFPATQAFNANDQNYAHANGDGSAAAVVTLSFSPAITCNSSVSFIGGMTSSQSATISINGGSAFTLKPCGTNPFAGDVTTIPFSGSITSIVITKTATDASGLLVYGFEIDGKRLVDDNITPPSVPSVQQKLRVNPDAGFAILEASVDSTNTIRNLYTGLGGRPEFIISKNREWADQWFTYHKDIQTDNKQYLRFDHTTGESSSSSYLWQHTPQVMGFNGALWVPGGATDSIIFWAFRSIEGFSKFGSFQNYTSTEGAFVFTGFKPAVIIAKCAINISSSNNLGDWMIYDTTRSPVNNPADVNTLAINEPRPEDGWYTQTQGAVDILSNGFKIRHPNSSPLGDTGRVYVYGAWAENPFSSQTRAV